MMKIALIGWIINIICYYILKRKRRGGSAGETGMVMAWFFIIGLIPYLLVVAVAVDEK